MHPKKTEILGRKVYRSVKDLPESPDAAYVGVNRYLTINIVRDLAEQEAGGAVCYATGFIEAGEEGSELQERLLKASGNMPLVGPDLSMPPLSDKVAQDLQAIIHDLMKAANPFDFQMFDWNDEESMARNFTAFMTEKFDVALCLLDYPREDICDQSTWAGAERGFVCATKETGTKAAVLSTFSDTISEEVAERLMKDRVATLAGIDAGVAGIQSAVDVGAAWRRPKSPPLLTGFDNSNVDAIEVLDEQFGPYLLVGGGGILVEMMRDSVSLLLPTTNEWVLEAFSKLKCAPLLKGFRGAPPADLEAAAGAIMAIAAMVENDPEAIVELDVNPLMVLAKGQGVVAADALICLNQTGKD